MFKESTKIGQATPCHSLSLIQLHLLESKPSPIFFLILLDCRKACVEEVNMRTPATKAGNSSGTTDSED